MTITYQVGAGGNMDIDFYVRGFDIFFFDSWVVLVGFHSVQLDDHRNPAIQATMQTDLPLLSPLPFSQLQDPTSQTLSSIYRKTTGTYSFTADKDGRHTYCFSNEMSSVSPKVVRCVRVVVVSPFFFCLRMLMLMRTIELEPSPPPSTRHRLDIDSFNVHGVLYVEDSGEVAPVETEIRALSTGLQGVKDEQEYIVVRERVHRDTAESTVSRPLSFLLYKCISGSGQDK